MAFGKQPLMTAPSFNGTLQPIRGEAAQAWSTWRLVRDNRVLLRETLPGVLARNRTPFDTWRGQRRLAQFPDREGYLARRAGGAVVGVVTLLQKAPEGQPEGVQIDFWVDFRTARRDLVAPEIARLAVGRAWQVIDQMELPGVPHAWLGPDMLADPSRELAALMQPADDTSSYHADIDSSLKSDAAQPSLYVAARRNA